MEVEYGPYFLRKYQLAPSPRTPVLLCFLALPGAPQQVATSPEPQLAVSTPAEVHERPTSRLNSASSFGLAKPPPPKFAVGAAEESEVVVIDTLREPVAKAAQAALEEDFVGTGNMSDDEELLLGDGAIADAKKQNFGDGVDSDSDPEKSAPSAPSAPSGPSAPSAPPLPPVPVAEALVERTEAVSTPRKPTTTAMRSSPSPPGGEAPLPIMPGATALSQAPSRPGPTDTEESHNLPVPQEGQLRDMDQHVEELLDRFFENSEAWALIQQVIGATQIQETGVGLQYFRIQVPSPYPGVQYRKSMHLDDRYSRYAKQGQTVEGVVEGGGEWLQISDKIFLPMKVGPVGIMQPITKEEREEAVREEKERRLGGEASPQGFSDLPTNSEAAGPAEPEVDQNILRPYSLRGLPESICKAPLRDPQALNQFYSQNPIDPLGDTPRRALHPWVSQEPN